MKHGIGVKDLDDKSNGMEILISDAFAKINPTDPLILAKHKAYYQAFFRVLIDLIVELFGLIIKPFDNQTES